MSASDGSPSNWFGYRLDLDGDTLIVGAWRTGANHGAVYVFGRDHGGLNKWGEVKKLVAADHQANDQFGRSAAVDGDTVVVGAYQYGTAGPGKAYIFERNHGGPDNWGLVKKLTANDGAADDNFGGNVAISGNTVVIGNTKHDCAGNNAGAAYIFERNRGGLDNWGLVKKLLASDAVAGDKFGIAVAVDKDRVVVGAEALARPESGTAYAFERNRDGPGNWGELAKLHGAGVSTGDGKVLAIAMHEDTVIVSAPYEDDQGIDSGSAHLFEWIRLTVDIDSRVPETPSEPKADLVSRNEKFGVESGANRDVAVAKGIDDQTVDDEVASVEEMDKESPESPDDGFTHWMNLQELKHYAQVAKSKKFWITAVEGRWHDGVPQYRIREEPMPTGHGFSWYWWHSQDKASFDQKSSELTKDGFRLVHSQTFTGPDGSIRYQSVWQKLGN